ncbi:hypothetical protein O6P43_027431 [Quillaja saponaria]|uniref:Uncharacterized protein n=1 Tax=Quillaja saponaria TaxID=32244 RepID=A0AAD7PDY1_QUISA|nr:hypothetical protein O6P43_027431 [Quillaja saponaria]
MVCDSMGNWFGKKKSQKRLVHPEILPLGQDYIDGVRLKVLMTRRQLKELIAKVDMSKGNLELSSSILEECSQGRLGANVFASAGKGHLVLNYERKWGLSPIQEE